MVTHAPARSGTAVTLLVRAWKNRKGIFSMPRRISGGKQRGFAARLSA